MVTQAMTQQEMIIDVLQTVLDTWTPETFTDSGCYAVDKTGQACTVIASKACKWCLLGIVDKIAIQKDYDYKLRERVRDSFGEVLDIRDVNNQGIVHFNDTQGYIPTRQLVEVTLTRLRRGRV